MKLDWIGMNAGVRQDVSWKHDGAIYINIMTIWAFEKPLKLRIVSNLFDIE